MKPKTLLLNFFVCVFCLALIGCQPSSTRDSVRKSDLVGTRWKLIELTRNSEVLPIEQNGEYSLEFRDEQIGGRTGCNNYRAGWRLGGDGRFALSGPVATTNVGCLPAVIDLGHSYITVLENGHTIVLDQDMLIISSTEGQLVFQDDK